MELSRKDAIRKNQENPTTNIIDSSGILDNLKKIDVDNINWGDDLEDTSYEVLEESKTFVWVLINIATELEDLNAGEIITIKRGNDSITGIFSYYAFGTRKYIEQENGQMLSEYSDEENKCSLYLGVNESDIKTNQLNSLTSLFPTSRNYSQQLVRVTEFEVIRENGEEIEIVSIAF